MTKRDKDISRILDPRNDANTDFGLLIAVLSRLGYEVRIRGSHFGFRRAGVPIRLTLTQHGKGAKPYQVRQVRRVILEFEDLEPDE